MQKQYIVFFDYISFLIILAISTIGLLFVYSSTYSPEIKYSIFFKKQFVGMLSGLIIYFICCFMDYRTLEKNGYLMYFVTIILLLFTSIKGSFAMGAHRWINFIFFKFQPSELVKLFFPAFFSYHLYTEKDEFIITFKKFIPIFIILSISAILIRKQPDLGTTLIILFSGIILTWLAGINRKFFLSIFIISIVAAPILYKCLKPYQRKRIEVFLGAGDLKKERYQIEQSKIAIGSGGFYGKGFLKGTQNKLMFLPESRTDFIFAVLCEEWGFLGAILVIVLYALLFFRFFQIICSIKNFFAQLFATGLIIHIVLSTIINICMVMGLCPVVGIPLPLISYGISNLWITFASLGCFNSIAMRRFYFSISRT